MIILWYSQISLGRRLSHSLLFSFMLCMIKTRDKLQLFCSRGIFMHFISILRLIKWNLTLVLLDSSCCCSLEDFLYWLEVRKVGKFWVKKETRSKWMGEERIWIKLALNSWLVIFRFSRVFMLCFGKTIMLEINRKFLVSFTSFGFYRCLGS